MEQLIKIKTWLNQAKSKVNYVSAIVVAVLAYAHYLIYTLEQTVEQTQKTVEVFVNTTGESMVNMEERIIVDEKVIKMMATGEDSASMDSIYTDFYKEK
jgi:hypothetical protein